MADKNITFDPSITARKAKEAVVYSREQYTGDMKFRSPNHASTTIRPTLPTMPDDNKGHEASGIEMQRQEKQTEDNYWVNKQQSEATIHDDNKGHGISGIEMQKEEKQTEESYWENTKNKMHTGK